MNIKILPALAFTISIAACATVSDSDVGEASTEEIQKGCLYASIEYPVGKRLQSKQSVVTDSGEVEMIDYPEGDWLLCTKTKSGTYRWIRDN